MFPLEELRTLARHKAALRRQIAGQRRHCVAAAAQAAIPFVWLDQAVARWRRLSPFLKLAALPLGWLLARPMRRRHPRAHRLLRWAPVIFSAARGFFAARPATVGRG